MSQPANLVRRRARSGLPRYRRDRSVLGAGRLQRCLIKHLEGLTVQYDSTVRDKGCLFSAFCSHPMEQRTNDRCQRCHSRRSCLFLMSSSSRVSAVHNTLKIKTASLSMWKIRPDSCWLRGVVSEQKYSIRASISGGGCGLSAGMSGIPQRSSSLRKNIQVPEYFSTSTLSGCRRSKRVCLQHRDVDVI